jgi:hypothetical protein
MLKSESECTITLLVAVITATAMADISYRYLELRLFARRITHLRARFWSFLCFAKCHYRRTIARCSLRKDPCINRRAAESRAGRNRSRMTIDHKSAFAVSDTVLLTQRLRQG